MSYAMKWMFAFCLILFHTVASGQYVTLKGKQFKLNGNDFYPLVMNYGIDITRNPPKNIFYATPGSSYGSTSSFECNNASTCNSRFQNDFAKIKAMGFNTIRISLKLVYKDGAIPNSRVFAMKYNDNLGSNQWQAPEQYRNLDFNNLADQASIDFFNMVKNVLTQAEQADLKVIYVTGGPGPEDPNSHIRKYSFTYDQDAVVDYAV